MILHYLKPNVCTFTFFVAFITFNHSLLAQCPTVTPVCAWESIAIPASTGPNIDFPDPSACGDASRTDCKRSNFYSIEITTSGDIDLKMVAIKDADNSFGNINFALFGPYASAAAASAAACDGTMNPAFPPLSEQIGCENEGGSVRFSDPVSATITGATAGEHYLLVICNQVNDNIQVVVGYPQHSSTGKVCDGVADPFCLANPLLFALGYVGASADFTDATCPVSTDGAGLAEINIDCPIRPVLYDIPEKNFGVYTCYWGSCVIDDFFYNIGDISPQWQGYVTQFFCEIDANGYPMALSRFRNTILCHQFKIY